MLINSKFINMITFTDNTVINSKAIDLNGGAIYLSSKYIGNFALQRVTANTVYAKYEGSFFYSEAAGMTLTLTDNVL